MWFWPGCWVPFAWCPGAGRAGRVLLSGGAGLLTLSGLGIIVGGDAGQQLWVLALMAVLLMAGLGFGERLFVWWGAAGVALCIMWAMRQYTFALLALDCRGPHSAGGLEAEPQQACGRRAGAVGVSRRTMS